MSRSESPSTSDIEGTPSPSPSPSNKQGNCTAATNYKQSRFPLLFLTPTYTNKEAGRSKYTGYQVGKIDRNNSPADLGSLYAGALHFILQCSFACTERFPVRTNKLPPKRTYIITYKGKMSDQ